MSELTMLMIISYAFFGTSVSGGYALVCSKIKEDFSYELNDGLGNGFE